MGAQLGLSRAAVQRLLSSGALPSVKVGRCRRVRYIDLAQFVADLAPDNSGLVVAPSRRGAW